MQLDARLRAFAAVARQGSFSLAAGELYVSQPAVSKHIASLEAELGARLVDRRRSGAVLTPTGRVLAEYVLRAEALLANAARAVAAAEDPAAGTVKVAASGIPGDYLVPKLLPAFREHYPRIDVDLRVTTSGDALSLVRAHEAELAVVGGFTAPPDLEFEALLDDEIVLAGPPQLASRRLRPSDLARMVWITREEGSSTREAVEVARWQLGIHGAQTLELTSWEAVKTMVVAGGGIAAISGFAIEHELASGALAVLDVPRWRVRRTISIATARDVPLTSAAGCFREALRERLPATSIAARDGRPTSDDERAIERLAVFVDGFEADAAEYVCDTGAVELERMTARGRLVREGRRFVLSEANEREVDDGTSRRHAEFFASLVEESEPHLTHLGHDEWTSRLARERKNIEAAVRWAGSHGDRELQLRMLGRCWQLWLAGGYPDGWKRVLEDALAEAEDPRLRLLALPTLSWLAWQKRDLDRARALTQERLRLARELGDTNNVAGALSLLAVVAEDCGDLAASRRLHEEAVEVDREAGDDVGLMRHLSNLATLLVDTGDLDAAEAALQESAAIARARGDETMREDTTGSLAVIAQLRGRPARALELVRDSAKESPLVGREDNWGTLEVAGAAAVEVGQTAVGAQLLAVAEQLRQARGVDRPPPFVSFRERALAAAADALGDTEFARETRRGSKLTLEQALELVRDLSPAPSAARRSSAPGASRSSSSRARRARR